MNQEIHVDDLLETAIAAAHAAGNHALNNISRRNEVIASFRHDVKLKLDLEAQLEAEAAIRKRFPDHGFLGEEDTGGGASQAPDSGYEWIVDPIDGTFNFMRGFNRWCSSVAVRYGNEIVVGAVFAPQMDEIFTAVDGGPALLNANPIRVTTIDKLDDAVVLTGLDKSSDPALPPFRIFRNILGRAKKTRIMGSAAIDICSVAAGRADGYFESGIFIWDVAAAGLIVRQAGGKAEILRVVDPAKHRLSFLASNGLIHEELRNPVSCC